VHDYDCMEREFDVSDPDFDAAEAAKVFGKCRLLVLRNIFPKSMMQAYRRKYDDYVYAIHTGKIDRFNTKTTDSMARDIVQDRGRKRHDIIVPRWLAGEEFTSNEAVLEILRDEEVLGPDMFLNHIGSVISEPGAPSMDWHQDTGNLWSFDSFDMRGIGGHDLPPYALSMFVPLFGNVTYDHGPTEYCMGSSHLDGLSEDPPVLNKTLTEEGSIFSRMLQVRSNGKNGACPAEHWRVPLVDMGDAVIFDYQIQHRGGPNFSPDSRALLFAMYSRFWFRDGNFDNTYVDEGKETATAEEFSAVRCALVNEEDIEHVPEASSVVGALENFAGISCAEEADSDEVEFFFTNNNVDGALVSLDGRIQEEIPPKESWLLSAQVGQTLWAHDSEGNVLDSWTVASDQRETILVSRP